MRDGNRTDTADDDRDVTDTVSRTEREVDGPGQSRRRYLGATAAVLTAATAGCSGVLGGGDGGSASPDAAVEAYIDAMNEGDADAANALLHPDGSATEITEQQAQELSQVEFTVESTEVLEQSDGRADVGMTVTMAFGGEENTNRTTVELRTHDGEWKLYSGDVSPQ